MKRKNIVVSAVLVSVLLASGSAFAEWSRQGRFSGHPAKEKNQDDFMPRGPEFSRAKMALKLQLATEQRVEIRNIHLAAGELRQTIIDQIVSNREQIKEIVKTSPYNESQLQELATMQGELIGQLIVIKAGSKAAILVLMTDEQKSVLEQEKPSGWES